jgi:hypothetical protein
MIYIVDIEAVETRYTSEWKKYLPWQIQKHTQSKVTTISGGDTPQATTPGAFLNFGGTNVYKSNQLEQIATLFCEGKINDGLGIWLSCWVLILALAACGMLVHMIQQTFLAD